MRIKEFIKLFFRKVLLLRFFIVALIFICGFYIGFLVDSTFDNKRIQTSVCIREGGYAFINPLLLCGVTDNSPYDLYDPLRDDIENLVSQMRLQGKISRASVYFREMNQGRWTGVNADDTFIPASLMKLPLFISYLKKTEINPRVLDEGLSLTSSEDENAKENFKPKSPLVLGGTYSKRELLSAMMKDSDNNAATVLMNAVSSDELLDVYNDFRVIPANQNDNDDFMSPKMYARFFRILYNASYLEKPLSQFALKIMAESNFNDGLKAGLPKNITVSHKFGERTVNTESGDNQFTVSKRELHDCGIVYFPKTPYLLCVMTEGHDFNDLKEAIAAISALVYKDVSTGVIKISN